MGEHSKATAHGAMGFADRFPGTLMRSRISASTVMAVSRAFAAASGRVNSRSTQRWQWSRMLRTAGYALQAMQYSKAAGPGVTFLKNAQRLFGVDWHTLKLARRMVNRLHYYAGKTKSQLARHRPWQGRK